MKGFPGAWRASGCFLNSGAVKELVTFRKKSKEIPFAKPLPWKIISVGGSRKGLRNVGSRNNEYIGGEKKKHIPKWLPVMPVIENHEEEIVEKRRRELWGYCGKTEKEEEKNDSGREKEERTGIELALKRGGGKVRFKIGGELGVCRRRGGIGKRVLCENWNFADENKNKSRLMR